MENLAARSSWSRQKKYRMSPHQSSRLSRTYHFALASGINKSVNFSAAQAEPAELGRRGVEN